MNPSTVASRSLARAQRSMVNSHVAFDLWPPLLRGDPSVDSSDINYPVEVDFDLSAVPPGFFAQDAAPGLERWQALLPPLDARVDLGAGGTPLVAVPALADYAGLDCEVFVKDESHNPTWSHKDRLNVVTVSAALHVGAPGVVAATSGNHGVSAAAHAAHAGIGCVVVVPATLPVAMRDLLTAYDAEIIVAPRQQRWSVLEEVAARRGYHPVSNLTATHTGHPFGPESYKTIAYEIHRQLGDQVPTAVFVPTGYGELLFGVWKGFDELRRTGVTTRVPRMMACEPAARGPLAAALRQGLPATHVPDRPTRAFSIATTVSSYRAVRAVQDSGGAALLLTDAELDAAQRVLARSGFWQELSGAAGVAGLRAHAHGGEPMAGPVVCIATSSGLKDPSTATGGHIPP
ncbi:MAG TPA: pyridoxal-phosphate dependent enzyme [Pseudonocardiaceae bacterium]|nr:pyridoxal-phosphate dependent enzyme [Pseudonocardiaceae bacterium]